MFKVPGASNGSFQPAIPVGLNIHNTTNFYLQMPIEPWTILSVTVSSIMVVCGVIGNGAVIIVISRVLLTSSSKATVFVYILFLSFIDMLYLLSQPFTVAYDIYGTWVFDTITCRLNIGAEVINKTLSVYVLVILSGDRYTSICKPLSMERRDLKKPTRILATTTILVFLGNIPMYLYTQVDVILETPEFTIKVCHLNFPKFGNNTSIWLRSEVYYAIYLEICYFCIPGCLIVTFYSLLLAELKRRERSKRIQRHLIRRGKVTKSIMVVILFYFFCWTPYWIFQVIIISGCLSYENMLGVLFAKAVYLLPLANSAFNPILYGVLNQRLRKQYRESLQKDRLRRLRRSQYSKSQRGSTHMSRRDTIMAHILPGRRGIVAGVAEVGEIDSDTRFMSFSHRLSRYSVGSIFAVPPTRIMQLLGIGGASPTLPISHKVSCGGGSTSARSIGDDDSHPHANGDCGLLTQEQSRTRSSYALSVPSDGWQDGDPSETAKGSAGNTRRVSSPVMKSTRAIPEISITTAEDCKPRASRTSYSDVFSL